MTLPEFNPLLIPPAEIPGALIQLAAWQSQLAARLLATPAPAPEAAADGRPDHMLTVDEAAGMLRRSKRWIYRHSDRLPFVKRLSPKSLLCSETGIKRWLERRRA